MGIEPNEFQFIGLPPSHPDEADVIFVPVPYERTVTYGRGTKGGPARILAASDQLETFDEVYEIELEERLRQLTVRPVPAGSYLPAEEYLKHVEAYTSQWRNVPLQIGIGGEHTVTYGLARGRYKDLSRITFVWVDAHADFADELEGRRWSHGTVARRIWEEEATLILVGIRSLSRSEFEFVRNEQRIEVFFAHQLNDEWERLIERLSALSGDVYLSIDVDGLDPSVIPSTGTPQPGGLDWYQTVEIIDTVFSAPDVHVGAADVVEFIPSPNPPGCDIVAAKLLMRIASAWLAKQRQ